jgi:hypothetical protein
MNMYGRADREWTRDQIKVSLKLLEIAKSAHKTQAVTAATTART